MFEKMIKRLFDKKAKPIIIRGIKRDKPFAKLATKKTDEPKRGATKPKYDFAKVKARRKMAKYSKKINRRK